MDYKHASRQSLDLSFRRNSRGSQANICLITYINSLSDKYRVLYISVLIINSSPKQIYI